MSNSRGTFDIAGDGGSSEQRSGDGPHSIGHHRPVGPRQFPLFQESCLTGNTDASRDIAQDVWIAIAKGIITLKDPSRFRAWAYRIIRNKSSDWIRREQTRRRLETIVLEAMPPVPESDGPADVDELRAQILKLTDEHQAVLTLFYMEGMRVQEIAVVLSIPEGTVKSRLYHARKILKNALEN